MQMHEIPGRAIDIALKGIYCPSSRINKKIQVKVETGLNNREKCICDMLPVKGQNNYNK